MDFFFFFNDTATTEIYTLSLHDALPIFADQDHVGILAQRRAQPGAEVVRIHADLPLDRKSTRLNSSHLVISYAVFCLKKKKTTEMLLYRTIHIISIPSTSPFREAIAARV